MRTELDVLNKNIVVQGCTFTKVGLLFERVDEAALVRAGACLQEMDNCGDWWWGDYLGAYAQFRLEADHDKKALAVMDETDQERNRRHYVRSHPSVLNGKEDVDTHLYRYKVAKFYEYLARNAALSNEHHKEAMEGADGDVAVAQEWLTKAEKAGWSRNELRAEIRASKRMSLGGVVEKQHVTQQELFGAKRWARAQMTRVDEMEQQEMAAMLRDLEPILQLAAALAKRLPSPPPPTPSATPGAKESIPGAPKPR